MTSKTTSNSNRSAGVLSKKRGVIKQDLINHLSERVGFSKKELSTFVDDVFTLLGYGLIKEKKVVVNNFGTFGVKYKSQRQVYNPRTQATTKVSARFAINFIPSKNLREFISSKADDKPHEQE